MFFCDTSALTKLIVAEPESFELTEFLAADSRLVSSELLRAELPRAVFRQHPDERERVAHIIDRVGLVPLSARLLDHAGALPPAQLRALDAIQLASALELRGELTAFVAYDDRLLEAASALGLPTTSPGRG